MGLEISNPTLPAPYSWATSCVATEHLVAALWDKTNFKTEDYALLVQEGRGEIQRYNVKDAHTALEEDMASAPTLESHRLKWGTKMGSWLTVLPSTVNRTGLRAKE